MSHTELEDNIIQGTSNPTLKKIRDAGIHTVEDLSVQLPKDLAEKADIGENTAEKAIRTALNMVTRGFITGKQLYDEMGGRLRLTTGSQLLDSLLGGGIESGTTTEIIGKEGSGKTQLMHCLAVLAQLPVEQGGLDGEVVWIDTESTFRPDRIREIAATRGLDPDKILSGIHVGEANTSQHQKLLVDDLTKLCFEYNIRLIIVDSMMAQLRGEYLGRGMLAARQNLLNNILQNVEKILRNNKKIVAIYTNQVMDDPGKLYGNPEKAAGGHIMGHAATTRLHIRRGRQGVRVVSLKKSPYRPDGEAPIMIDEYGIRDTEKNRGEAEDS